MKTWLPIIIAIIVALGGWYYIAQPKGPAVNGTGTVNPVTTDSGINGVVMAGPTCPVERNPPDPACADKPVATNISIFLKSNPTQGIAFTTSDAQGTFKVSVPPGEYIVMSGPNGVPYPRCTDTVAIVTKGAYTKVAVSCDTGIR